MWHGTNPGLYPQQRKQHKHPGLLTTASVFWNNTVACHMKLPFMMRTLIMNDDCESRGSLSTTLTHPHSHLHISEDCYFKYVNSQSRKRSSFSVSPGELLTHGSYGTHKQNQFAHFYPTSDLYVFCISHIEPGGRRLRALLIDFSYTQLFFFMSLHKQDSSTVTFISFLPCSLSQGLLSYYMDVDENNTKWQRRTALNVCQCSSRDEQMNPLIKPLSLCHCFVACKLQMGRI